MCAEGSFSCGIVQSQRVDQGRLDKVILRGLRKEQATAMRICRAFQEESAADVSGAESTEAGRFSRLKPR